MVLLSCIGVKHEVGEFIESLGQGKYAQTMLVCKLMFQCKCERVSYCQVCKCESVTCCQVSECESVTCCQVCECESVTCCQVCV